MPHTPSTKNEIDALLPVIALVGRVNVGKSTLFNRLTRSRKALVAPLPGLTRDRREQTVDMHGYRFNLVDTGGLEFERGEALAHEVKSQVEQAVAGSQLVWLVVDGTQELSPLDQDIFLWLKKQGLPLHVLVNKADNAQRKQNMGDYFRLGADVLLPISAMHGHGIEEVLEAANQVIPILAPEETDEAETDEAQSAIRVTFLGRPNVGKSSLVNAILGSPRMIVSPIAGTTREAIDLPFTFHEQEFLLIDTAGIRRRARTTEYVDKIGALSSLGALRRAHVAVVVIDAMDGITEQDARIVGYVLEQRRALVIAVNKWDLLAHNSRQAEDVIKDIQHQLRFAPFAPLVKTSGLDNIGITKLFGEIRAVSQQFSRTIQTADLNRVVQAIFMQHPPPAYQHKPVNLFYGTQVRTRPPSFSIATNRPQGIREDYTRFFENQLRFHFGFKGTPLEVTWRGRGKGTTPKDRQGLQPRKIPSGARKKDQH